MYVNICSEKPNDEEWLSLNQMKIPLLLNYAQCKLLNKEYYSVIEHCTTVLKTEPGYITNSMIQIIYFALSKAIFDKYIFNLQKI